MTNPKRIINIEDNGTTGIILELNQLDNKIDNTSSELNSKIEKAITIAEETKKMEGKSGVDGLVGERGEKGEKGDIGLTGSVGGKGEKGDRGERGLSGTDGTNGKDGRDGLDGKDAILDEKILDPIVDKKILDGMEKIDGRIKAIDQRWKGGGLSKVSHDTTLTGSGTPIDPLIVDSSVTSGFLKLDQTTPQTTVGNFHFSGVVTPNIYGSGGSLQLSDSISGFNTLNITPSSIYFSGSTIYFNTDGSGYLADGNINFDGTGIQTPALNDYTNQTSVDPIRRHLVDSAGNIAVDWQTGFIAQNGVLTIDGRHLVDSSGNTTANWSGDAVFDLLTKITKYNNIATVSNGVPAEFATVDLTAQQAAITATTLYTPAASGMFRISIVLQVTRAASTSSILGGTTGVVITYTEPNGSVAQSIVPLLTSQGGGVIIPATGNIGNTTTTQSQGSAIIYAKSGVAIQYAIGYTSVGATGMLYSAHLKLEAL